MNKILNYRNEIYGLCIIWIIFFHIEAVTRLPHYIPLVSDFLRLGNCGVDIFLFLSGYCLFLSFKKNPDLNRYFHRRFLRIIVPYLLIAIPYNFWEIFFESGITSSLGMAGHYIYNLSGLSLWFSGVQTTWFVHAIIIFYLLFPVFFQIVKRNRFSAWLLLGGVYAFTILLHQCVPSSKLAAIAYSRLPAFTLGIIMACHGPNPFSSLSVSLFHVAYLFVTILILHVNVWLKRNGSDYFWGWSFFITLVFPLLFLMERIVNFCGHSIRKVLKFVGDISLEAYLAHITLLHIYCFYGFQKSMGWWTYLIVPIISISLAYLVSQIAKHITTRKTTSIA